MDATNERSTIWRRGTVYCCNCIQNETLWPKNRRTSACRKPCCAMNLFVWMVDLRRFNTINSLAPGNGNYYSHSVWMQFNVIPRTSCAAMKPTKGEVCVMHLYANESERLQISSNKGRQLLIKLKNSCRVRSETFHILPRPLRQAMHSSSTWRLSRSQNSCFTSDDHILLGLNDWRLSNELF